MFHCYFILMEQISATQHGPHLTNGKNVSLVYVFPDAAEGLRCDAKVRGNIF